MNQHLTPDQWKRLGVALDIAINQLENTAAQVGWNAQCRQTLLDESYHMSVLLFQVNEHRWISAMHTQEEKKKKNTPL